MKVTYLIIGAGLSGLHAAYALKQAGVSDFMVLEARDRLGGRIWTKNGIDFGAAWFQNHHETLLELTQQLGLTKFHQYSSGKSVLVYSSMAPAHEFITDPNAPSAFRIAGGTQALIAALADSIQDHIRTQTKVQSIKETTDGIHVITDTAIFEASHVVVALPPRLATTLRYTPELPDYLLQAMETTHTWMSNAIKVGITFKQAFWRDKGYSGTMIGQMGAVTELYDHSAEDDSTVALMGFVNEGLRDLSSEERQQRILSYIATYLGDEVYTFETYEEKDWSIDSLTSCDKLHSVYISPQYGKPEFTDAVMHGKLHFIGAETAPVNGGYMDGALRSSKDLVHHLLGITE